VFSPDNLEGLKNKLYHQNASLNVTKSRVLMKFKRVKFSFIFDAHSHLENNH